MIEPVAEASSATRKSIGLAEQKQTALPNINNILMPTQPLIKDELNFLRQMPYSEM